MSEIVTVPTTTVRINGAVWHVPRGFGAEYKRHAEFELEEPSDDHSALVGMLSLIGYAATEQQIAGWDLRRRVEASVYASNVHARASDNPIQRHPPLPWLPEPWKGPWAGEGAFAGPTPTVIV